MAPVRVFVVEPSAEIRRYVRSLLGRDPRVRVVGSASSSSDALSHIERADPELVICGEERPGAGPDLVSEIRRRWPWVPALVVSRSADRDSADRLQALGRGATDYVPIPAEPSDTFGDHLVSRVLALTARR